MRADQEKHQRNPRYQVPTLTHSILKRERGIYSAGCKGLTNEVGRTEVRAPNTPAPVQERGIYSTASPTLSVSCLFAVEWLFPENRVKSCLFADERGSPAFASSRLRCSTARAARGRPCFVTPVFQPARRAAKRRALALREGAVRGAPTRPLESRRYAAGFTLIHYGCAASRAGLIRVPSL